MNKKAKELAGALRKLADEIEKTEVETFRIRLEADDSSFEMPDFSKRHYHNGIMTLELTATYYSPKLDSREDYKKDLKEYDKH